MRPFDIDVTPEYVRNYWAMESHFAAWSEQRPGQFLLIAAGDTLGPWRTYREAVMTMQGLPTDRHHALVVLLDKLPSYRPEFRRLVADSYRRTATPAPAPLPLSSAAREAQLLHYGFSLAAARAAARSPWLRGELALEALRNDPSGNWEGRYVLWAGDHLWGAFHELNEAENTIAEPDMDAELDTAFIVTKLEEKRLAPFARAVVQTYRRHMLTGAPVASACEGQTAL